MNKYSLSLLALLIAGAMAAQIPTANLIAYYPFCGNANDKSGNGLNGTVYGATLSSDRFGNPNGAYDFNGANNYISLPPTSFVGLNIYSYSIWMKPSSSAPSGFIAYSVGGANDPYCMSMNYNAPSVFAGCYNNGANPVQSYIISTQFPNINNWIHVVVTRDLSTLKLYVNSVLEAQQFSAFTNNQASDYGGNPHAANIGTRSNLQNFFPGKIDDIRIYSSVLTQNDVIALYNEPPFLISMNSGTICSGSSFTLAPIGATSYTFSSGSPLVSPITTSIYTVTAASSAGCVGTATAVVTVNKCTGIEQLTGEHEVFVVFPNPTEGNFIIRLNTNVGKNCQFILRDLWGRIIKTMTGNNTASELKVDEQLAPGCYIGELIVSEKCLAKKRIIIAEH